MRFTVVITTYQRPELLAKAIASVAAQSDPDFECIVVSDADPSAAAVMPDDDRFRFLLLDEPSGAAAARNAGVATAKGDVVTFCDDDDELDPRRLVLAGEGVRSAAVGLCWSAYIGEPQSATAYRYNGAVGGRLLTRTTPAFGALAVRAEAWVPLDESFPSSEDVEWWIRQCDRPMATVPLVGYWVRRHDGPRHGNGTARRVVDSRRLLDLHADFFQRNPEAHAFRLRRIGLMQRSLGQRRSARRSFVASLRVRPSAAALKNLVETRGPDDRNLSSLGDGV